MILGDESCVVRLFWNKLTLIGKTATEKEVLWCQNYIFLYVLFPLKTISDK